MNTALTRITDTCAGEEYFTINDDQKTHIINELFPDREEHPEVAEDVELCINGDTDAAERLGLRFETARR